MKNKIQQTALIAIIIVVTQISFAQAQWNTSGGNYIFGTKYLGSNGSSIVPLELKTIETGANALPINFYTNNTLNLQLTTAGDLDLVNASRRYQINGNNFLWHNGNPQNIYLGIGAGNATSTGSSNTFCGNNSGNSNTNGFFNTFVGSWAGNSNLDGFDNAFIGKGAGLQNQSGPSRREAVGEHSVKELRDFVIVNKFYFLNERI